MAQLPGKFLKILRCQNCGKVQILSEIEVKKKKEEEPLGHF